MSEARHPHDPPSRPNRVAEFVLSSVDNYQKLNAPTLIEGDKRFRRELVTALEKRTAGRPLGREASILLVHELDNDKNVVVKRLETANTVPSQGDMSTDVFWDHLQSQHALVDKYFGRRYVPYTEFVVINTSLGYEPRILPGREYVMVQEKITGDMYTHLTEPRTLSPELKSEMIEFIKRYEVMMRQEKSVIEDPIMIDNTKNSLKIFDTNQLVTFNEVFQGNAKQFLESYRIDPQTITTTEDLINVLTTALPELAGLHGADYATVVESLDFVDSALYDTIYHRLYSESPSDEATIWGGKYIPFGFDEITRIIKYFAPEGYHNDFIKEIMTKFDINQTDLSASE